MINYKLKLVLFITMIISINCNTNKPYKTNDYTKNKLIGNWLSFKSLDEFNNDDKSKINISFNNNGDFNIIAEGEMIKDNKQVKSGKYIIKDNKNLIFIIDSEKHLFEYEFSDDILILYDLETKYKAWLRK